MLVDDLVMSLENRITIFWFRRDLRLNDNTGLYHALRSEYPVLPLFIFDKNILDDLDKKQDKRLTFIHDSLLGLKNDLRKQGSDLLAKFGTPRDLWKDLLAEYDVAEVYTNNDYEPYALDRDREIAAILKAKNIPVKSYKDQVIFEKEEILSGSRTPYTIFTPYSRAWKAQCNQHTFQSFDTRPYFKNFLKIKLPAIPTLAKMGFQETDHRFPSQEIADSRIAQYEEQRNYPSLPGTTHLGIHLRFGTMSIRELARKAEEHSQEFLNQLIWRDFYQQILFNFPHVGTGNAFRSEYDRIIWRNNETEFKAWCEGRTGYPLVDAGMHELNETGFMHNRVRMVVASFLTKHLLIDWRWGEAYFAEKLLDYDFAANNGGWQWAAGSGTDASPYFRIFNPSAQAEKFDPKGEYIKKWVPELNSLQYPQPIVDHKYARERCLRVYKEALNK